jgi:hypothetical protein
MWVASMPRLGARTPYPRALSVHSNSDSNPNPNPNPNLNPNPNPDQVLRRACIEQRLQGHAELQERYLAITLRGPRRATRRVE